MKADPFVVDLHKFGPHYYEFGRYLMKTSSTDGSTIVLLGEFALLVSFRFLMLNLDTSGTIKSTVTKRLFEANV